MTRQPIAQTLVSRPVLMMKAIMTFTTESVRLIPVRLLKSNVHSEMATRVSATTAAAKLVYRKNETPFNLANVLSTKPLEAKAFPVIKTTRAKRIIITGRTTLKIGRDRPHNKYTRIAKKHLTIISLMFVRYTPARSDQVGAKSTSNIPKLVTR